MVIRLILVHFVGEVARQTAAHGAEVGSSPPPLPLVL